MNAFADTTIAKICRITFVLMATVSMVKNQPTTEDEYQCNETYEIECKVERLERTVKHLEEVYKQLQDKTNRCCGSGDSFSGSQTTPSTRQTTWPPSISQTTSATSQTTGPPSISQTAKSSTSQTTSTGPQSISQTTSSVSSTLHTTGPQSISQTTSSISSTAQTPGPPSISQTTTLVTGQTTSTIQGQQIFLRYGTFHVPDGVTEVDVICIGGGGGGRDGHGYITGTNYFGGHGGNSSFGSYLSAEGGKGANADDSGGEGGKGTVANGGSGGVGGGCSAGAGAAGQTSKPGDLYGGSSTYPYCGAGGSSGGSSCGSIFATIPQGTSGPGGTAPGSRNGGMSGGGGGSRAGGRAGGGGGYSRAVVSVGRMEAIPVWVGEAGYPSYAKPGKGIVVVAWGRPIDPYYHESGN